MITVRLVHDTSEFLCSPLTVQFTAWHRQRHHRVLRQHGYWPVYYDTARGTSEFFDSTLTG